MSDYKLSYLYLIINKYFYYFKMCTNIFPSGKNQNFRLQENLYFFINKRIFFRFGLIIKKVKKKKRVFVCTDILRRENLGKICC